MLRETRRAIRYHHPLPNLKLMPARRMFSLSETVVLVPQQLVKPQRWQDRQTDIRPWRSSSAQRHIRDRRRQSSPPPWSS